MKTSVKKEMLDQAKAKVIKDSPNISPEKIESAYKWILDNEVVHSNDVSFLAYMLQTVAETH